MNDLQQQQPQLRLDVNINDYNIIMSGLQELPHRISDPIIKKVFAQVQEQLGMNK